MSGLNLILLISVYLFNNLQLINCGYGRQPIFVDNFYDEYDYDESYPPQGRLNYWNRFNLGPNRGQRIPVDPLPFYYSKRKQFEPQPSPSVADVNGYYRSAISDNEIPLKKFKLLVEQLYKFCRQECTTKFKCNCGRFERGLTDDEALQGLFEAFFNAVSHDYKLHV